MALPPEIETQARTALNCGERAQDVARRFGLSRADMRYIQNSRHVVRVNDGLGEGSSRRGEDPDHIVKTEAWADRPSQQRREADLKEAREKHTAWLKAMGITPAPKAIIVPAEPQPSHSWKAASRRSKRRKSAP